jgi:hypothetical protein
MPGPTRPSICLRVSSIRLALNAPIAELMRGGAEHSEPSNHDGRGYDTSQPRVPAGHPDGGQWTRKVEVSGAGRINDPRVISDVTPDNHWMVGADYAAVGHHETPQQLFRKLRLRPDTLAEFDKAVSGPLGLRVLDPITGEPIFQHRYDRPHREYNRAVGELFKMYLDGLQARGIAPEQMTPDHAKEFRKLIYISQNPRIRGYLDGIRLLRNLRQWRVGD